MTLISGYRSDSTAITVDDSLITADSGLVLGAPAGYSKGQLIFDDTFVGPALDNSKWIAQLADQNGVWSNNGALPSPLSGANSGGNQANYYDPNQVSVSNGLTLTAVPSTAQTGYSWKSGAISTHGKFSFAGGFAQIYMQQPDCSTGAWPLFFHLEGGAEIDTQSGGFQESGVIANTCVSSLLNSTGNSQHLQNSASDLSQGYHVFGMEYVPGVSVKTYFDGVLTATFTANVPTGPITLAIALAMAQNTTGSHPVVSGSTPSGLKLQVAEVQVYSLNNATLKPSANLSANALVVSQQPMSPPAGYTSGLLIFEDTFSGTVLDSTKWIPQLADQNGISSNNGGLAFPLSGENSGGFIANYFDPNQVHVSNGLSLVANKDTTQTGYTWKSGCISTHGKFTFTGGYVQIKMKQPDCSTGAWPAFFCLEGGGELDVQSGGFQQGNVTANFDVSPVVVGGSQTFYQSTSDLSQGYHVYGMEYTPGQSVKFYFDGTLIATYTANIPSGAMTLVINLKMAQGTTGWHSAIGTSTPDGLALNVSDVQVYSLPTGVNVAWSGKASLAPSAALSASAQIIGQPQHVQGGVHQSTTASVITVTLPASIGNGNAVCGAVCYDSSVSITSIVDDRNNSYNIVSTITDVVNSRKVTTFALGNIANAAQNISVFFSGSSVSQEIMADEYSGVALVGNPVDDSSAVLLTGVANGGVLDSNQANIEYIGDMLWGCAFCTSSTSGVAPSSAAGVTARQVSAGGASIPAISGDALQPALGESLLVFNSSLASSSWAVGTIALIPLSAGVSGPTVWQATANLSPGVNLAANALTPSAWWMGSSALSPITSLFANSYIRQPLIVAFAAGASLGVDIMDPQLGCWNTTPAAGTPTFADGNHTVTGSSPGDSRVYLNQFHSDTGKWYFEFKAGKTMSSNDNIAFGDYALTNWVALWSTGFQANFAPFGSLASSSCPKAGDHCAIAFDLDNKLIWFVNFTSGTNPGHWNDDGTGSPPASDPATGVGGATWAGKDDIPSTQNVYLGLYTNTGFEMTVNLGDSAFVGTVPAGFTPWMFPGGFSLTNTTSLAPRASLSVPTLSLGLAAKYTAAAAANLASIASLAIPNSALLSPSAALAATAFNLVKANIAASISAGLSNLGVSVLASPVSQFNAFVQLPAPSPAIWLKALSSSAAAVQVASSAVIALVDQAALSSLTQLVSNPALQQVSRAAFAPALAASSVLGILIPNAAAFSQETALSAILTQPTAQQQIAFSAELAVTSSAWISVAASAAMGPSAAMAAAISGQIDVTSAGMFPAPALGAGSAIRVVGRAGMTSLANSAAVAQISSLVRSGLLASVSMQGVGTITQGALIGFQPVPSLTIDLVARVPVAAQYAPVSTMGIDVFIRPNILEDLAGELSLLVPGAIQLMAIQNLAWRNEVTLASVVSHINEPLVSPMISELLLAVLEPSMNTAARSGLGPVSALAADALAAHYLAKMLSVSLRMTSKGIVYAPLQVGMLPAAFMDIQLGLHRIIEWSGTFTGQANGSKIIAQGNLMIEEDD